MLSISRGHSWRYLTDQVGKGRENYYTQATERGEPPGVWRGNGAVDLGLSGEVTEQQMAALYGEFVDPRSPDFESPAKWETAEKLGDPPRNYRGRDEILSGLLAGEPDATPERKAELRGEADRQARAAVHFLDATFSPPKSVSVLHTAFRAKEAAAVRANDAGEASVWRKRAEDVEASVWAGNDAMLDYLQREAGYSRVGYHGQRRTGRESVGQYVDAHRWTIGSFFQHTARPTAEQGEQPNLHIHNAILNRVQCPDGKFRTLDSRGIHKARGAAGALAERVMYEELVDRIGCDVAMRRDGKAREITTVPETVRNWFSARRQVVTARTEQYADLYRQRTGQEPNALQMARFAAKAAVRSREKKLAQATTPEERVERWDRELRSEVDEALSDIAEASVGRATRPAVKELPAGKIIEAALADVQATKAQWSRRDLVTAIEKHMPDVLGITSPAQLERIREALADRALQPDAAKVGDPAEVWRLTAPELVEPPAELRREDGTSTYHPHGSDRYATRSHLTAEQRLEDAARRTGGASALAPDAAKAALTDMDARLRADGRRLGDDQAEALHGILTSGRPMEVLIGPAGTGKSFTVGALAEVWEERLQGRVFGLALSQKAAGVLAEEGISKSENIAQWLRLQKNIGTGKANAQETVRWQLSANDLVVVDESSMADTQSLADVQRRVEAAGAKMLLVGDNRQLSAVGAGGGMSLIADAGKAYELSEVRRFKAQWEREASLRLRQGDAKVLPVYERHGRLVDGGSAEEAGEQAMRAWLADTLSGRDSLVVVDTNEQAAHLSQQAQAELVRLGRVQEPCVPLGHESAVGTSVGVDDLIQVRRNNRRIKAPGGAWVVNRDTYRVTAADPASGELRGRRVVGRGPKGVEQLGREMTLPTRYVRDHVTLAYVTTAHGAEGATVDTCHSVLSTRTGADAGYVDLTRGRVRNIGYVITRDEQAAAAAAELNKVLDEREPATPMQILGDAFERHEPDMSALAYMREELADASSLERLGAIWTSVQDQMTAPRYEAVSRDVLPPDVAERVIRDDAANALWRTMRGVELAGMDPRQVLEEAVAERELGSAQSAAEVLDWRINTGLSRAATVPTGDTYTARTVAGDEPLPQFARELADVMERRVDELGRQAAGDQPGWAVDTLGPVPEDPIARLDWSAKAGRVAAYREQYSYDEPKQAIGAAPAPGNPEARASWYAAWRALGEPDTRPDEATQEVGQLYATIAAHDREETWAPAWVEDELRDTHRASQGWWERSWTTAAEARVEEDPQRAKELHQEAELYARLARGLVAERNQLEEIDQARSEWYAETADSRAAAQRARDELRRRGIDPAHPEQEVTTRQLQQEGVLRELAARGVITEAQQQQLEHDPAAPAMWNAVDRAAAGGRDPRDVLAAAVQERALDSAESPGKVLHWRVQRTLPDEDARRPESVDQAPSADRDRHLDEAALPGKDRQPVDRDEVEPRSVVEDTHGREPSKDVAADRDRDATDQQQEHRPEKAAEVEQRDRSTEPEAEAESAERGRAADDRDREPSKAADADARTTESADRDRADETAQKGTGREDQAEAAREALAARAERSRELAEQMERAAEARRVLEQRCAERAAELAELEQRRRLEHARGQQRQRQAERDGPSLSL